MFKTVLLSLSILLFSVGCSKPIEVQARDGIATASGFIGQEVITNKDVCGNMPEEMRCQMVKKAALSLSVAIDALEVYCSSPDFNAGTGPCTPPDTSDLKNALSTKLASALQDLARDVDDVKKLGG